MKITHIKYQIRTIGVEGTEGTFADGCLGKARTGIIMLELYNGDHCIYWDIIAEDKTQRSKVYFYRRMKLWLVEKGYMDISRLSTKFQQEYLNRQRRRELGLPVQRIEYQEDTQ